MEFKLPWTTFVYAKFPHICSIEEKEKIYDLYTKELNQKLNEANIEVLGKTYSVYILRYDTNLYFVEPLNRSIRGRKVSDSECKDFPIIYDNKIISVDHLVDVILEILS